MDITTLPKHTDAADCLTVIDRDGCVILRDLAAEIMDEVRADLDPYFAATPFGEGSFVGYATKRMGGLIVKSTAAHALVLQPTILAVVESLLRTFCSCIQLNLTQAIQIWPGEVEQIFHRDDELFPYADKRCEFMVNALWAMDDFTVENGATRVVPGSHREPLTREPDPARIAYAAMPAGSVLLYLGSVLHSGGANRTNWPRTALTMSYSLGWLRQAENLYLSVPPGIARTLPQRLRELLGYAIHAPNLGWYEGQDPSVVLGGAAPATLAARDYLPPDVSDMLHARRHALLRARDVAVAD